MGQEDQIDAIQRILNGAKKRPISKKLEGVLSWANLDAPEYFDTSFIESLAGKSNLSERQEKSLDNIISKFEIDIDKYL